MSVFVDTSALLAVLDHDEAHHAEAAAIWADLLERDEDLVTTSYVLVETYALAQRRLGLGAVRTLTQDFVPLLTVIWIDAALHDAGLAAVFGANRRDLSLVDCVSFGAMRQRHLDAVFAFDADFGVQGFRLLSNS